MSVDVLIIDDSNDQLRLISRALLKADSGIRISTANSGDEALRNLRASKDQLPRVILLDLRMPNKTGHQVLDELKDDEVLKKIPVCMFSNGDLPGDICLSYAKGAAAYFVKPMGIDALMEFANAFRRFWFQFASLCHASSQRPTP